MFDDRPLQHDPLGPGARISHHPDLQPRRRPREAKIGFNVGQGTQDLGFRSDVDDPVRVRAGRAGHARRPRRRRHADDRARSCSATRKAASIPRQTPPARPRLLLPPADLPPRRRDGAAAAGHVRGRVHPRARSTVTQKQTITVPADAKTHQRVVPPRSAGSTWPSWAGSRATTTSTPPAAPTTRARPRASRPRT